jgi:hypothetical protein
MRQHSDSVSVGLDLGQAHDFSVATTLDLVTGRVLDVWRTRGLEYTNVCRNVVEIVRTWGAQTLMVDSTAMGAPVVDILAELLGGSWLRKTHRDAEEGGGVQVGYPCIYAFTLTSDTKLRLIRRLQVAIERHHLKIPRRFDALIHELKTFREIYSKTGRPTFSNPPGASSHDDCVVSIALAVFAMSDDTRASGDTVLRMLDRLSGSGHGWNSYPHPIFGGADPFRRFQLDLCDAARLRRKLELGLLNRAEYDLLAKNELPWPGWPTVWSEHNLRPWEYPNV